MSTHPASTGTVPTTTTTAAAVGSSTTDPAGALHAWTFDDRRRAAVKIQSAFRGALGRRRAREVAAAAPSVRMLLDVRSAAVTIQTAFRGAMARSRTRSLAAKAHGVGEPKS